MFVSWKLVCKVQTKLFNREWLGNLLFLGIVGFVLYQSTELTDLFYKNAKMPRPSGELYSVSAFPYTVAFFFVILQYLPILFLSASFFFKGKVDTSDTLRVRPVSNVMYYTAVAVALLRVVCTWGVAAFVVGMLVNLFASLAPFNVGLYFYYFITLVIPSAVFMIGLAFMVFSITRNASLGMVMLLGFIGGTLSLSGESWQGILNFTGINLPNEYSEITGFTERGTYLLQRLGWLLAGVGMVVCASLCMQRPENAKQVIRITRLAGGLCLLTACFCLLSVHEFYKERYHRRAVYAECYNRYAHCDKLYLLEQELEITSIGETLSAITRCRLWNNTAKRQTEFLLYLNPRLRIEMLKVNGKDVEFKRDNQVIIVEKTVDTGDTLSVDMKYAGEIDGEILYLDVPETELREQWSWNSNFCYTGKEYVFLEENQVVLYPEALWYPTSVPPVNSGSPYAIETNFTRYTLRVRETGDKTFISQGRRQSEGNSVTFLPEHPLPGITLVAGHYECWSARVDSVNFEFYFYPGHLEFFKRQLETQTSPLHFRKIDKTYPFERLSLVETPPSLCTPYRNQWNGTNLVQPELVCFPQGVFADWIDRWQLQKLKLNQDLSSFLAKLIDFRQTLIRQLSIRERWLSRLAFGLMEKDKTIMNPFYALSLYQYRNVFVSDGEFPGVNKLLLMAARNGEEKTKRVQNPSCVLSPFPESSVLYFEGVRFLKQYSLQEGLENPSLNGLLISTLMGLKTDEFYAALNRQGAANHRVDSFFREYLIRHRFQTISIDRLHVQMQSVLHVELKTVLRELYTSKGKLPAFVVRDMKCLHQWEKGKRTSPACFSFAVYNDSDVGGFVTLIYESGPILPDYSSTNQSYSYFIPAREGRRINCHVSNLGWDAFLRFGLSENDPVHVKFPKEQQVHPFHDTMHRVECVSREEFFPRGEFIVDNEQAGFSTGNKQRTLLQRWFPVKQKYSLFNSKLHRWQSVRKDKVYGYVKFDQMALPVTNRGMDARWQIELPEAGEYEEFAYHTRANGWQQEIPAGTFKEFFQYYTVEHGHQKTAVTLTLKTGKGFALPAASDYGWLSLGSFDFPAGPACVVLHDKGVAGQIIWADAVKWVKVK